MRRVGAAADQLDQKAVQLVGQADEQIQKLQKRAAGDPEQVEHLRALHHALQARAKAWLPGRRRAGCCQSSCSGLCCCACCTEKRKKSTKKQEQEKKRA